MQGRIVDGRKGEERERRERKKWSEGEASDLLHEMGGESGKGQSSGKAVVCEKGLKSGAGETWRWRSAL
jgi:hypothetical protein